MPEDELQNVYKDVPMRDWEAGPERPREILLEVVQGKLVPVGKALDLCGERAWNSIYLAQARFEVTALFPNQEKLEEAERKASQAGLKVDCSVGNWRELEGVGQRYDFAYDLGCFGRLGVSERDDFVDQVHSILKKGGYFLLMVLSYKNGPGEGHFTRKQIESLFHPRFEILKVDLFDSVHDAGTPKYISFLMKRSA